MRSLDLPDCVSSSSLSVRTDSRPAVRLVQNSSTERAPGTRSAIPTIAISLGPLPSVLSSIWIARPWFVPPYAAMVTLPCADWSMPKEMADRTAS